MEFDLSKFAQNQAEKLFKEHAWGQQSHINATNKTTGQQCIDEISQLLLNYYQSSTFWQEDLWIKEPQRFMDLADSISSKLMNNWTYSSYISDNPECITVGDIHQLQLWEHTTITAIIECLNEVGDHIVYPCLTRTFPNQEIPSKIRDYWLVGHKELYEIYGY